MSTPTQAPKVELIPFQKENISTNQQNVPIPHFAGTRVIALRWISKATDQKNTQVTNGGKKG